MKTTLLILVLFLFFSCDDNNDNTDSAKQMSLSLDLNTSSLAKSRFKKSHVKIVSFKILVERIKFHSSGSKDSLDFKAGPFVVSVDSNNTMAEVTSAELPIGSYDKISFKIHKPEDGEVISDPDFTTGGRYSMIIKGIYNGSAFTYYADESMKEELVFDPALVISETGSNYNTTIQVNSANWFFDPKKQEDLDPTNEADFGEIEQQIKDSFKAFKDNNKDGKDD